jgi:hypothetical protein
MNILPLIPGDGMKDRCAPTFAELIAAHSDCSRMVPQFRR